ncbi:hypothetical protein J2X76_005578 [Neorhizobium sp. 2083]|uniref:hypothetical protein n=1 Tax=Neorhizobium sp. 2083 TaxID=2817762 RepID=UPI0028674E08|nr:hypothetical protein [Neorhizobium sp. 2083]MDR6820381.1 hypothetical protein [Neorhizobium sp. 2083]
MVVHRKGLRAWVFPFQAARFLILIANFLLVAAACLLVAAFVGYAIALTCSYAFLPAEWTKALWQWAADLYDRSSWFKAATMTFFVLLFLPLLGFWPGRDPIADAARERETMRLNDELIAARQRGLL